MSLIKTSTIKTSTLKNENGATLIEILIAAAIITISAFSVLEIIRIAQANLTSVSRQLSYDVVKMNVGLVLDHSSDCIQALNSSAGGTFTYNGQLPVRLPQITAGGEVLVRENNLSDGVLFKDIIVRPVAGVAPVSSVSQRYYLAELIINAEKQGDISGPRVLSNESNPFRFYIITDQANKMVSCSSSGFLDALKTCNNTGLPLHMTKSENGEVFKIYTIGTTVNYASGNAPPIAESPTADPVCGMVPEMSTLNLKCKPGKLIQKLTYANFGTNNGTCGTTLTKGGCQASTSEQTVIAPCYGRESCSVTASIYTFGDPCRNTGKTLAVRAVCEDAAKVEIPAGLDPNSMDPIPTPTPAPPPTGLGVYCVTKQGEQQGTVAVCVAGKKCYWEPN